MNFQSLVSNYLIDLKKAYEHANKSNAYTPELSYRPVIDSFFRSVIRNIDVNIGCVSEPSHQGAYGRPDWRFHDLNNLGVYGYIEAKKLQIDENLRVEDYKNQIEKYKLLNHNLILTDGLDFIFIYPGESTRAISLIDKATSQWSISRDCTLLENELRKFFLTPKSRKVNEKILIEDVAKRAIPLSENINRFCEINELVAADHEIGLIKQLNEIKKMLAEYIDNTLEDSENFADYITQVLLFGLIYSHRVSYVDGDTPKVRYTKIKEYFKGMVDVKGSQELLPFKGIVNLLNNELENELGFIGSWYQDAILYLSYIDLTYEQISEPDYHGLFEKFLSIYKPLVRFDYGAFYTPKSLAKYLIHICDQIIGKSNNVLTSTNNTCTVIDPCCGTGTFLEQIIRSDGVIGKLSTNVIGYEILPAPYALANYRMAMLEQDTSKIKLILADTLSDYSYHELPEEIKEECADFIVRELEQAFACSNNEIEVILCNPPVSDSYDYRKKKHESINVLMEDFRPPITSRKSRSNVQKQVRNSFMYFLRWSIDKLENKSTAVLALIVPSTFLESISYKYSRMYLNDKFDNMWALKFDSDIRANERKSNIFKTLQGRTMLVAERGLGAGEKRTLKYLDITSLSMEDKSRFFETTSLSEFEEKSAEIELDDGDFSLQLKSRINKFDFSTMTNSEYYNKCWNIFDNSNAEKCIFQRSCSGIKLGATGWFVNADERILKRRFYEITNGEDTARNFDKLIGDQSSPKKPNYQKVKTITKVLDVIGFDREKVKSYPVRKYSFRPFVEMSAFIDEDLLRTMQNENGKGTRLRPEIMYLYSSNSKAISFVTAKNLKEQDSGLGRFVSFSWELPDNDLTRRGNAMVLSNIFPKYKNKSEDGLELKNNINEEILNYFRNKLEDTSDINIGEVLTFYVFAIMCSNVYLKRYYGQLYFMNDGIEDIRVPLFTKWSVIKEISDYGKKIAELEKPDCLIETRLNRDIDLNIQAFGLREIKYKSKFERLCLYSDKEEIQLNIPKRAYELKICGYSVIKKWLELRKECNIHREFNGDDLNKLINLVERVDYQIEFINELDNLLKEKLDNIELLPPNELII